MKKYIKLLLVLVLPLFTLSCHKEEDDSRYSEIVNIINNDDINELGIYSNHFKKFQGNVNVRATSTFSNNASNRINAWYLADKNAKSLSNGGDYFINEISIKFDEKNYVPTDLAKKDMDQYLENFIFGKDVYFSNKRNGQDIFQESLYIPESIKISGIGNKIPKTNLIRINKESFSFKYNKDSKNDNGLLVLLSFKGESYNMDLGDFGSAASERVFRAVHVKNSDKNEVELPRELFEGIPTDAIVTLYIGRGNGKVVKYNNEEHYVRALTQQQIVGVIN